MTTPARRQYLRIKKEYQDDILLFRMGDFYETFDDDAKLISRELEIALTSREFGSGHRVPLAGIPYHSLEGYLARLIRSGHKVAICEQTSDPATSKGIVDREVVRVVTPGTIVEDSLLDKKSNNYLAAVVIKNDLAGLAYVDITTSQFTTCQVALSRVATELSRLEPSELLVTAECYDLLPDSNSNITIIEPETLKLEWGTETLLRHFGVSSLEAYGCEKLPLAIGAAGAIIDYLCKTQKNSVSQLTHLYTESMESYMLLDHQTISNLELFEAGRWGASRSSLLSTLDNTKTSMGGRLLRRWLGQPLLNVKNIDKRLDVVQWFYNSSLRRDRIMSILEDVADLERLVNKVRGYTSSPRDLLSLASSLELTPLLKSALKAGADYKNVSWLYKNIRNNKEIIQLIRSSINDDPSTFVGDGTVIRPGFSPELDSIKNSSRKARDYIADLENVERQRTGIKNLKVGYNKVFGYYIEISKSNLHNVPEEYIRRQTLVGGERYITPEMKEYESQILDAQGRISDVEQRLFRNICQQLGDMSNAVMDTAQAIAHIDGSCSLAFVASRYGYVRPEINNDKTLIINQGRHPVVEVILEESTFVPNDTRLSNLDEQVMILTGPNMAGKSTYIRQVALIVLMSQVGSFVPAESASIGIVDRIFTRVGLQDDLTTGQSTFMVEMIETAGILNHATGNSLIILDEIGRGTSTYDGLAIARSVAEYIHNHPRLGCKTLFATHYHELTELAEILPRIVNYNVAVSENKGNLVFLRRILPGGADKSYGVQVARLAGIPIDVINRAWDILNELENADLLRDATISPGTSNLHGFQAQLPFLPITASPTVKELLGLDIASMTPLQAINKLYQIQEDARKEYDETNYNETI